MGKAVKNLVRAVMISFMIAGISASAFAGWVETEASGDITYFSGGKVKSASAEDDMWSVIDTSSGVLTMVSPRAKSYATGTVDDFCAMIRNMMGGMNAQQKAMFEAMMKKHKQKTLSVRKVGPGGKVAGYNTDKYRIEADGKPQMDVWVSTDSRLSRAYKKMMKKAMPMVNKMASCSEMGGGGMEVENSKEYRKLEEKGWILKSVSRGMVSSESETVKLEEKKISPAEFKVPPGYKKVSLEELLGG